MSFSFTITHGRRYLKTLYARHPNVYYMGRWLSTNASENRWWCGHIRTVLISIRHTKCSVLLLCVLCHSIIAFYLSLSVQRSNTNNLSNHTRTHQSFPCLLAWNEVIKGVVSRRIFILGKPHLLLLFGKLNSCLDTATKTTHSLLCPLSHWRVFIWPSSCSFFNSSEFQNLIITSIGPLNSCMNHTGEFSELIKKWMWFRWSTHSTWTHHKNINENMKLRWRCWP